MKKWLAQFKISNACDNTCKDHSWRKNPGDAELGRFSSRLDLLEERLRGGPPNEVAPAGLHNGIMAAVRSAAGEQTCARSRRYGWAGVWATASLLALGAGIWVGTHLIVSRLSPSPFRLSANVNQQLVAVPSTMLSPLSEEWEALNLDMQQTAEFLLSSIP